MISRSFSRTLFVCVFLSQLGMDTSARNLRNQKDRDFLQMRSDEHSSLAGVDCLYSALFDLRGRPGIGA